MFEDLGRPLTSEECVLKYLSEFNQSDLHFCEEKVEDTGSLEELVKKILIATRSDFSANSDGVTETIPDKYRSVLDIWRHVKFFRPDTDIFTVMRTLFVLSDKRDGLYGQFCGNILRRTFKYLSGTSYRVMSQDCRDEFSLYFEAWEHIGETV